jgi:hypothetical protein
MDSSPEPMSDVIISIRCAGASARAALAMVWRAVSAAKDDRPRERAASAKRRRALWKKFIVKGRGMNASGVPRKRGGRCLSTRPGSFCVSGLRRVEREAGAAYLALNLPLSQGSP